jgi:ribonuclease P protein component
MEYSFKKYERLYKKKDIDNIFSGSKSLFSYPFKIFIIEFEKQSDSDLSKILISIPKKKFRKAFKRNSLKRKVKEAYRLNKQIINSDKRRYFHIAFIYIGEENPDFKALNSKMIKALSLIIA